MIERLYRQRQLEEERSQKLKQLSDARERQKREIRENKMRRVQLTESCEFFKSMINNRPRETLSDHHEFQRSYRHLDGLFFHFEMQFRYGENFPMGRAFFEL